MINILTPWKMTGRYADGEEIIVGGYDEEDCMYKLIVKQRYHGRSLLLAIQIGIRCVGDKLVATT